MSQVSVLNMGFRWMQFSLILQFTKSITYVVDLRPFNRIQIKHYNYVMKWKETEIYFEKLTDLLDFMIYRV